MPSSKNRKKKGKKGSKKKIGRSAGPNPPTTDAAAAAAPNESRAKEPPAVSERKRIAIDSNKKSGDEEEDVEWRGPGAGHLNPSRVRRDERRVGKAESRISSSDSRIAPILRGEMPIGREDGGAMPDGLVEGIAVAQGFVNGYDEEWKNNTLDGLLQLQKDKQHKKILDETTKFLETVTTLHRVLERSMSQDNFTMNLYPCSISVWQAYSLRAQAKFEMGDISGSIRDSTEALPLIRMYENEHGSCLEVYHTRICTLMHRSRAMRELGDLKGAQSDLKGCCSAIRGVGDLWRGETPTYEDAVDALMQVMALIKVKDGAVRPHYTPERARSIMKELGVFLYSKNNYKCFQCKGTINLSLCGGCERLWFCGSECLKKAWGQGHKSTCKGFAKRLRHWILPDEGKEAIYQSIEKNGFAIIGTRDGLRGPIFLDHSNGRLFDSLSDSDIFFKSEADNELVQYYDRTLET